MDAKLLTRNDILKEIKKLTYGSIAYFEAKAGVKPAKQIIKNGRVINYYLPEAVQKIRGVMVEQKGGA